MTDTTRLDLDALDECYHRGGQPTMDEGKALVARVRELEAEVERLWGIVNERNAQLADGWQQRDDLADRAEAAEATIQRVRDLADEWRREGDRYEQYATGSSNPHELRSLAKTLRQNADAAGDACGPDTEEADRG